LKNGTFSNLPAPSTWRQTPEFDGNMHGDLAYTPQSAEAKGVEQMPIRLTVGLARDLAFPPWK